jgi:hypothetical protein
MSAVGLGCATLAQKLGTKAERSQHNEGAANLLHQFVRPTNGCRNAEPLHQQIIIPLNFAADGVYYLRLCAADRAEVCWG